jgi:UDP-3-O-[3-hydroxymyristoyl] glucosamine N-acyltransferase
MGEGVTLGPHVSIGAGAIVSEGVSIGAGTRIIGAVRIGRRVRIAENCVVGAEGLAVTEDVDGVLVPFRHLGGIDIGDDAIVGAGSILVRGILQDTIIGPGARIGNGVNVGHNVTLGAHVWISSHVIVCGSAVIEDHAMIGAGARINNHVRIGARASVGLGSVVTKSVPTNQNVFGSPAAPLRTMKRLS